MKPNVIEIDDKGVFCYEAPEKFKVDDKESEWYKTTGGYMSPFLWNERKLEQARRDRVYFNMENIPYKGNETYEISGYDMILTKGKQYPVPDGYEIKIETYSLYNGSDNPSHHYAILVPKIPSKQEFENECLNKPEPPKQPSIEEAAKHHVRLYNKDDAFRGRIDFITGAKSQAAKEYWYEQFKQEKL